VPQKAGRKQLTLRLPSRIKRWLAREAVQNASSQNSEIIRALRERMERDEQPAGGRPA
jgi:predicted HicB family RNase H-like nuclease